MPLTDRITRFWTAALAPRSLDARVQLVPRAAAALLVILLVVAIGGQFEAGSRLDALNREGYPALLDARALTGALADVREELDHGTPGAAHEQRLDSLAERFHAIARAGHGAALPSAEVRFDEYLSLARRASWGAASPDAATTPAGIAAAQAWHVVESELAANRRAAERGVETSIADAAVMQGRVMFALGIAGALVLLAIAALGLAMRASVTAWVDAVTANVDALVAGDMGVVIRDTAEAAPGRLNASLRRLARQLRENAETAHMLAAGACRRAARTTAPRDPVGEALARLTTVMNDMTTANQRIARGELTIDVAQCSAENRFGLAHAAMIRRVAGTLQDVEVARAAMGHVIEGMRADAVALASSANVDADRLRRTEERLTSLTLQARADAARGIALVERAMEGEVMVENGAESLKGSLAGVSGVLRSADCVQRLAREAGLLAIRSAVIAADGSATDATTHAEAARVLATEASAAASTMTRLMIDGTDHAHQAGVAFDRIAFAVKDGTALVRELGTVAQRQAMELHELDQTVGQVHCTTSNSAETARQLVARLDALASLSRRLEAVIRRVGRGATPAVTTAPVVAELSQCGPTAPFIGGAQLAIVP